MRILLTGGVGYIGSHTAVELIQSGYDVIIVDDLSNSEESVIDRIEQITNNRPVFYKADVTDRDALDKIFSEQDIDAVTVRSILAVRYSILEQVRGIVSWIS